ncbi:MAG: hypothetical protein FJ090_00980 [Deltaproteobacteria bacterium]|nr:hypothetical protein [Deltaproteobacteria bacterium]
MNTQWQCPLCKAANLVPAPLCRVCRTPWPGIRSRSRAEDDDAPLTANLLESLPAPAALACLAFVLFFWWAPVTRPFSVPNVHSGWSASVRADRHDELRLARRDLLALAEELGRTLDTGAPLSPTWNDRLTSTRQKYQVYGERDRTPKLGAAEVKLHTAVIELASIRYQFSAGQPGVELRERLALVFTVLSEVAEELNNA